VPATGDVDVPWTLPSGGALRLSFRSASGDPAEPGDMRSVRARDADGREIQVRLFRAKKGGGWAEGTGEAVPYETQSLAPGAYDVVWYDRGAGGTPLGSARAVVSAGEITPVEFVAPR